MIPAGPSFDPNAPFDDEEEPAREDRTTSKPPKTIKPPKPMTADRLQRAALHYLERYASSAENLRRVLRRRVLKACRATGDDPQDFEAAIDDVVARCVGVGYVNDEAYARGRAVSLRRQGRSARAVQAKLREKGLDRDTAEQALALADEDSVDPEHDAAHAFARRRRLGPYRKPADPARRDKDMAALARGGFSYEIARRVIDGEARERR